MKTEDPKCYEFGGFRLMVEAGDLTYESVPVPIKPKTAKVLAVLLKNNGKFVIRDMFNNLVWKGVHVEKGNLNNAIWDLRQIFRERGSDYIRTKSGKGYCFEGHVNECESVSETILEGYFPADGSFGSYISRHGFFEDYTQRFSELIPQTKILTLFFIHSRRWRENHRHVLNSFLTKPGSTLRVFLPNLNNDVLFAALRRGFLDGSTIRSLVIEAYQDFADYSFKFPGKVSIREFDHYPTYSFYRFDELIIAALYPTVAARRQVPTFEIQRNSGYWSFFESDLNDLLKRKPLLKKELIELKQIRKHLPKKNIK